MCHNRVRPPQILAGSGKARHFEEALPQFVQGLLASTACGPLRAFRVVKNLCDCLYKAVRRQP